MTPCIGWPAPDGCPHWGGDFHGCQLDDQHNTRTHVCPCGATTEGRTGQRGPRDPTVEHGSAAAVKRHQRAGEPMCHECRRYRSIAEMERRRVHRDFTRATCGWNGGRREAQP